MDWQGLSRQITADHQHEPQTLGRLELALGMAREALQIMAGHGHQYHLAEGPGSKFPEWPRKLYHVDQAPNGVLVVCEEDAVALGAGWFDSFQKAQFWDGMETQFNGRGGVAKSPRVPVPSLLCKTDDPSELERDESRRQFVEAFRALNRWEKPVVLEPAPLQPITHSDSRPLSWADAQEIMSPAAPGTVASGIIPESEPETVILRDSGPFGAVESEAVE